MDKDQRDAQLRGSLLDFARRKFDGHADGWVSGSGLVIAAKDKDRMPADEGHGATLLADLVELGFLDEQAAIGRGIGERKLAHRRYRLTEKGRAYCWGEIPEVAGVEVP